MLLLGLFTCLQHIPMFSKSFAQKSEAHAKKTTGTTSNMTRWLTCLSWMPFVAKPFDCECFSLIIVTSSYSCISRRYPPLSVAERRWMALLPSYAAPALTPIEVPTMIPYYQSHHRSRALTAKISSRCSFRRALMFTSLLSSVTET